MDKIRLNGKEFELFIPENEILDAIRCMAARIEADVEGADPLFVGILNGAFMFVSELMGCLNAPHQLTFARYASYRGGLSTMGTVDEIMPISFDVKDRLVVLLEDVIDTGYTMRYVMDKLRGLGASDVRLATLIFKPDALKCDLVPHYVGIRLPNDFIVGHGMDYDERGRAYRDIYRVVSEHEA